MAWYRRHTHLWGHPSHGDMGLGDMGSRGHSTEDIHTFRVRHGDMGTWGLGGMGFRGHGV